MKNTLLISCLACYCLAAHASAQSSPSPSPKPSESPDEYGPRNRPRPPLLNALDADGDGVISAAELQNAPTALRSLDANKDGSLTPNEFQPKPPENGDRPRPPDGPPPIRPNSAGPGKQGNRGQNNGPIGQRRPGGSPENRGQRPEHGHRPPPPLISALDADRDHEISPSEIDQAANHLKALDKNNDGQLTEDEICPPRPPRPPDAAGEQDGSPDEMPPPAE